MDSLTSENFQMADRVWNRPIMHCKPLVIDCVMYAFVLFFWQARAFIPDLHTSIWRPDICIWRLVFTNYYLLAPFLKKWALKQVFRCHFGPQVKLFGWNTALWQLVDSSVIKMLKWVFCSLRKELSFCAPGSSGVSREGRLRFTAENSILMT